MPGILYYKMLNRNNDIAKNNKTANCAYSTRLNAGFTLVELFIVLALLGTVLAIIYNLFFYSQDGWSRSTAEARVLQDARLTIMNMEREIRQARVSTSGEDAIVALSGSSLRIYADISKDNHPELIEYTLINGSLFRQVWKTSNDSFPYEYDQDEAPYEETIVLSVVVNTNLFLVEVVDETVENDPRRQVTITIQADDNQRALPRPLQLNSTVYSRSRVVD